MTDILRDIVERLLASRGRPGSIFLYPHVSVDGDSLGSSLALLIVLRKAGISVRLVLDEAVPEKLLFLPQLDLIEKFDESGLPDLIADQTAALAIDCADSNRVGRRQALFDQAPLMMAIDHHVSGGESGPLRLIDPAAAAVGEIIFTLVCQLEERLGLALLDPDVATLLMTAISSDTGGFVFSNTTAKTFQTAAALMRCQVDLRQITYQLFERTSPERLRLMGRIFTDARFSHGGRLILAAVDQQLMDDYGATDNDLEGVITFLRNVGGVEAAFLLREMRDGSVKISIRSNSHFNSAEFACGLGGGGHPKAAGIQLRDIALADAEQLILEKAGERL